jgi:hypothetical protein
VSITLFFLLLMAQRELDAPPAPDERVAYPHRAENRGLIYIAPGAPPALSFRYYEGKLHHRFGNAELLLDDAGH